jgi:hypothetical protein
MEDIGVMTMGFYRECTDSYMTVGVPAMVSKMMVEEESEEPLLLWAETLFPEWEMGLDTTEFIPKWVWTQRNLSRWKTGWKVCPTWVVLKTNPL